MMDCSVDTWVLATTKQEESDNISLVKSCTFVIFCSLPILGLDASEVLWRTGPEAAGVQGHRQIKSYYNCTALLNTGHKLARSLSK